MHRSLLWLLLDIMALTPSLKRYVVCEEDEAKEIADCKRFKFCFHPIRSSLCDALSTAVTVWG